MNDIRSTITESVSLPSEAGTYVNRVVAALEEREHSIVESLVTFATQRGLDEVTAKSALQQAGLTIPVEPEPEPEVPAAVAANDGTDESQVLALLRSLDDKVNALAGFARQHGFRG